MSKWAQEETALLPIPFTRPNCVPHAGRLDRYACSKHVMTGTCLNGEGMRCEVIEERVLAEPVDRLMEPEAAAHALRPYAEESNRLNRERRSPGASDLTKLTKVEKKIASMIAFVEDGGHGRGMMVRLRGPEARRAKFNEGSPPRPFFTRDIHPNVAVISWRRVAQPAGAARHSEDCGAAAAARNA